ncbi:hypothetical protein GCM10010916_05080 [Paenibacillus abyssi]|uniref:Uncharacterized protein n=1 Tax=Paenibacillus abyssi TaxID=1340531 RepID=A0A917FN63_9BACL|nr:hypothetical protein GCM10010916_05080 [Paenibacillus abyssi]
MANRDTVAKRLNTAVNQIHRWVDIVFPELRNVFKILTCTSAIATLRLFPLPKEISRLTTEQVIAGWKQYVKRHAGVHRAEQLIALAKRSVGAKQALHAYKLHLAQLLEEYDLAQQSSLSCFYSPAHAFAGWTRSTEYRETLRKRARTRSVRKTDLHPLVRCDEGMKGLGPVETWE